mmetsp:Transcript_44969/g.110384  ORF Transcript_44969/g.110384 Transcript_44969/m.110384 type:complete len:215 (-) Transcript_44969:168-812(-)
MQREENADARRMYRVLCTAHKMLEDRGYHVSDYELNPTRCSVAEFVDKCETGEGGKVDRSQLIIVGVSGEDSTDKLLVFFASDAKVGVRPIRAIVDHMEAEQTRRAVLVVQDAVTPFAAAAMQQMRPRFHIEQFRESELLVNVTEHELVPEHRVLADAEKRELLKRYKCRESQLPKMQAADPVARYYGLVRGQVVKIVRPSETAGRYVTYRVVV